MVSKFKKELNRIKESLNGDHFGYDNIIEVSIYTDNDDEIIVTGEITQGRSGKANEYGVKMEPDEESSINIIDAVYAVQPNYNLSPEEAERAKMAMWDKLSDESSDYDDSRDTD